MCTASALEINDLWKIKDVNRTSVLELRAIKSGQQPKNFIFRANQYSSIDEVKKDFEREAIRINEQGYNAYYVMNPINPNFCGKSASDSDIASRELLLIDIDRAYSAKEPANQFELNAALALANTVKDYLEEGGWHDPIIMMSGNGYHLYYKLDQVPNDQNTKLAIEDFLKALAAMFDNNLVKIDTSVFNASRISKVVGTIARKGNESLDRPYRMARVIS